MSSITRSGQSAVLYEGASGVSNPRIETGNASGPASYATGGFTIDLSARFGELDFLQVVVETEGSIMPYLAVVTRQTGVDAGKALIKLMRVRYDKLSSVDSITGQPSGVTVQSASGATVNNESTHTHGIGTYAAANESAHTHTQQTNAQSLDAVGGAGTAARTTVQTAAGTVHTHTLSGSSAAGSAHNHVDNNIYQHQHTNTQAETNTALTEVSAGTNLSTTTFRYLAVGPSV